MKTSEPKTSFDIQGLRVGESSPCFILAEIAQAHDGSLGTAHAYIDAVAKTGANAIKFQTHIASAESTVHEKFRVNCFPQDVTRFEYWKRMQFSKDQWKELANHAKNEGLIFLSTPFSNEAVDLLMELNIAAWKIGSGELSNHPMLEKVSTTGKPVLLSTGMSSWEDIDEAVSLVRGLGADIAIFQSTTAYPCPPNRIGLNILAELSARYNCPTGLSDHSGSIFPSLAAVVLGAKLIEIHAVFSKDCFGPDVKSSVTISELGQVIQGVRFIESILSSPVDKNEQSEMLNELKSLFTKSMYASKYLPQGHVLSSEDILLKKPGTGIPAKRLDELLGKRLAKSYDKDEQFREVDLE